LLDFLHTAREHTKKRSIFMDIKPYCTRPMAWLYSCLLPLHSRRHIRSLHGMGFAGGLPGEQDSRRYPTGT